VKSFENPSSSAGQPLPEKKDWLTDEYLCSTIKWIVCYNNTLHEERVIIIGKKNGTAMTDQQFWIEVRRLVLALAAAIARWRKVTPKSTK
jgi:hypothetical protein